MSFKTNFSGRDDAYILFNDGVYQTVKGAVTKELFQQHLEGEISLGIIPITKDNTCRFGVIDDDSHKSDKSKPVQAYDYNKLLKFNFSIPSDNNLVDLSRLSIPPP